MATGNSSQEAAEEQARREVLRDKPDADAMWHDRQPEQAPQPEDDDRVRAAGFGACGMLGDLL